MDKEILKQYIDACEQVKEAKADILRLKKNRKTIVQDRVSGSAHEFPYTAKSFHIEGLSYPVVKDPDELDRREAILWSGFRGRRRLSARWRRGCSIPQRMQRIIRYRVFEEMTWAEVAQRMGRRATADGVRIEYENFMKAE
ncbi:MAG: RNA polymerase subunit sigma-70 [Lachnospiraceae bacterium]